MFTNNRLDFYNNKTYEEKTHASALSKGIPSFVVKGLDLTGTILTSGIFTNTGTFGQLGNEGETLDITTLEGWTSGYDGYLVIHSILSSSGSTSFPELSTTRKDTDPRDTGNIKYFTIYKLNAGAIEQDYRHINYVKSFYLKNMGGSNVAWVLNGFTSDTFDASVLAGNRTILNDKDISYDDTIHSASLLQDILKDIVDKGQLNVGGDKPFEVSFVCRDATSGTNYNVNLANKLKELLATELGYISTEWYINFKIHCTTTNGLTNENADTTNVVTLQFQNGAIFNFKFNYSDWANVKVTRVDLKQEWSLDELGLDGTWSLTDVPGNIKKAYDKVVSIIGNKTTFTITQPLYINSTAMHYEFSQSIEDDIVADYGQGLGTTGFEFSITFGLVNGVTNIDSNLGNFITITGNNNRKFMKMFNYAMWENEFWTDTNEYKKAKGTTLYTSGGNNEANITLSESMLNFDTIAIEWKSSISYMSEFKMRTSADDGVTKFRHMDVQGYNHYDEVNTIWYSYQDTLSFGFLSATSIGTVSVGSGKYVIRNMGRNNETSDVVLDTEYGITKVIGLDRRAVPRTAIDTQSLLNTLEELPRVETPNVEPEIGDNMQDRGIS